MKTRFTNHQRRGGVTVQMLLAFTGLLGFTALSVDVGVLMVARNQMQSAADAGALAGAIGLLTEERMKSDYAAQLVMYDARVSGSQAAFKNPILSQHPSVELNVPNSPAGDIVMGYLADPVGAPTAMSYDDAKVFNAVQFRVRRDESLNGPIGLLFARILGFEARSMEVVATAAFEDGVIGYKIPAGTAQTADLLPLSLHLNSWTKLLDGTKTSGDNFTYNPDTGNVTPGADGIPELNIYPGAGADQLPPGNFGTVDIGNPNNSTADITRQILHGVNESDLAWFGGELKLSEGSIELNGDTGLSAAIKDDLEAIKGQARSIPLFTAVAGPGNNAYFTVVAFGGVRVMDVKLTGPMKNKRVLIQPAYVVDRTALADPEGQSYYVYRPPMLVR